MIEMLYEALIAPFSDWEFMRRALFASVFVVLVTAPIGTFLILRRLSLVADSMSHAILPGIAVSFFWGGGALITMLIGGVISGLLVALAAGFVSRWTALKEDSSFASFYLISLAFGVMLITVKSTNVELSHILFGYLLAVSDQDLLLIMIISSLSLLILTIIYRPLVIDCFDPAFLKAESGRRSYVHLIFLLLMVINLVAGYQVLGTLMVVGVMLLPAITARFLGRTIGVQLVIAAVVGVLTVYVGLVLSYHYQLPASATIMLLNGFVYIVAMIAGPCGGVLRRYYD